MPSLQKPGKGKFSVRLTFSHPGLTIRYHPTLHEPKKILENSKKGFKWTISEEIRAKLKGFMKTAGWSTDYAHSLTKDQWTSELESRFFDDICQEITSLAVRKPVCLALDYSMNWVVVGRRQ